MEAEIKRMEAEIKRMETEIINNQVQVKAYNLRISKYVQTLEPGEETMVKFKIEKNSNSYELGLFRRLTTHTKVLLSGGYYFIHKGRELLGYVHIDYQNYSIIDRHGVLQRGELLELNLSNETHIVERIINELKKDNRRRYVRMNVSADMKPPPEKTFLHKLNFFEEENGIFVYQHEEDDTDTEVDI